VADQIKRTLGTKAEVTVQQAGTIIALVPGDREAAERSAQELLRQVQVAPVLLGSNGAALRVMLACGIVAFPQTGPPLARSIPLPVAEPGAGAQASQEVTLP
jgi:hypothetical protein